MFAIPFRFRHLPLPYARRSLAISRIPLPVANVLCFSILPTILKLTTHLNLHYRMKISLGE